MTKFLWAPGELRRQEGGSVAIIFGIALPVLCGFAALAVDAMHAYATREQLLTSAEAAAAAAIDMLPSHVNVRSTAITYATLNYKGSNPGEVVASDDIQIGIWNKSTRTFVPKAEGEASNAVRVVASRLESKGNALPTFFGGLLGVSIFNLSASAVAARFGGYACVLALEKNGVGFDAKSNADVKLTDCGLHVHSSASDSLSAASNAKISVINDEICLSGDYELGSNSKVSPSPEINCDPMVDPFASISAPEPPTSCTVNLVLSGRQTVEPGNYCKIEIKSNATVTFEPGDYFIRDSFSISSNSVATLGAGQYTLAGDFQVRSNARVSGESVVINLSGDKAKLEFASNAEIRLTAPSSGPLAGFVFFQDGAFTGEHDFASNSNNKFDGVIYLPGATLNMSSNSKLTNNGATCLMIIANRFKLASNASFDINPDYSFCKLNTSTRKSRIVG